MYIQINNIITSQLLFSFSSRPEPDFQTGSAPLSSWTFFLRNVQLLRNEARRAATTSWCMRRGMSCMAMCSREPSSHHTCSGTRRYKYQSRPIWNCKKSALKEQSTKLLCSVVDPYTGTLNLDPDPGFWPNLDPDPELYSTINFETKNKYNCRGKPSFFKKSIFLKNYGIRTKCHIYRVESLNCEFIF